MTFEEYKNQILDYLKREKELTERDIQDHQNLSDEEKVEQGYLIKGCLVSTKVDDCYELIASENNTKLRAGDKVVIKPVNGNTIIKATIVENFFDHISITTDGNLVINAAYDIYVTEAVLLDPIIKLLEELEDGASGSSYLEYLGNVAQPQESGYGSIDFDKANIPAHLNDAQKDAIANVFKRPSVYCIQGPPGTGKTDVLSTIAKSFSMNGKEVLVISNTHQAVNNALNKLSGQGLPVVKIGEALKAQDLSPDITLAKTYSAYLKTRGKRRRYDKGAIVGMTLHAAIINLGLRKSGFAPSLVLADEAGQIPLSMGAAIGTFGAGTIVFIGDDRQMPPIYHPDLVDDPISVSVFSHVSNLFPQLKTVLDTTYRMNTEITEYVSKCFYEPYGIKLKSFKQPKFEKSIEVISIPDNAQMNWQEYNPEEAKIAAEKALEYSQQGLEVAIVTPFRKQVNCIREFITDIFGANNISPLPLVDTVERLQGQDVDVIIISTSISSTLYYRQMKSFVLEPHRLNVMFSRAKEKVLVIKSDCVKL